ncbi:hypothetical protein HDIA_0718 [Hartmannibacter diazotrophicus]|uniref:Transposase n=1 Tax=Hartmannibacter diazotrophicus TaxID=1482074 RepID=A0A2C9D271_9HYPH|nr:hypothetical protein [Hartmannibacter diazotrophicus]SON54259.1 hypothetical protein HDIA_0718 [Hartmannibacter diazotrophicus]
MPRRNKAQRVAIQIYYRKKREGKLERPVSRIVRCGRAEYDVVKMTPRRREILWHVAYSDEIVFRQMVMWTYRRKSDTVIPQPYLDGGGASRS